MAQDENLKIGRFVIVNENRSLPSFDNCSEFYNSDNSFYSSGKYMLKLSLLYLNYLDLTYRMLTL